MTTQQLLAPRAELTTTSTDIRARRRAGRAAVGATGGTGQARQAGRLRAAKDRSRFGGAGRAARQRRARGRGHSGQRTIGRAESCAFAALLRMLGVLRPRRARCRARCGSSACCEIRVTKGRRKAIGRFPASTAAGRRRRSRTQAPGQGAGPRITARFTLCTPKLPGDCKFSQALATQRLHWRPRQGAGLQAVPQAQQAMRGAKQHVEC